MNFDWVNEKTSPLFGLRRKTLTQTSRQYNNLTFEMCTDLGVRRLNTSDFNFPSNIREEALFWIIFTSLYYPVTLLAFYLLRKRYAMLRNRSFLLLLIQALSQLLNISKYACFLLLQLLFGNRNNSP